ncbi:hypothetical protein WJX72_002821 [[Myrmecia] bisecta]|uniref:Uncharacterized protein n=1 Tax=[Myrmecia] bisecta TaxID=41462 RepID=A0AAW1PF89_9CHLO
MAPTSRKEVPTEQPPRQATKPFTVPEGYVPPTIKEQFQYAYRRHPYYRYGYALVGVVGLAAYAVATVNKVEDVHKQAESRRNGA